MDIKIKVFVDTNVLISSILYPNSIPFLSCAKALRSPYALCTSDYCIKELHRIFNSKLSSKLVALNIFMFTFLPYVEVVKTSDKVLEDEKLIRDKNDRLIFRGAVEANADLLITGDNDFLEANIQYPKIIKPRDFLENY